jgi:hypothetical protein
MLINRTAGPPEYRLSSPLARESAAGPAALASSSHRALPSGDEDGPERVPRVGASNSIGLGTPGPNLRLAEMDGSSDGLPGLTDASTSDRSGTPDSSIGVIGQDYIERVAAEELAAEKLAAEGVLERGGDNRAWRDMTRL